MDETENLFHDDYWDNDAARVANMQIFEDLDMRLFGNTTKKANDKDNAKIKMVEVSQLHFDRDFKNVFQQILNRECIKKKCEYLEHFLALSPMIFVNRKL